MPAPTVVLSGSIGGTLTFSGDVAKGTMLCILFGDGFGDGEQMTGTGVTDSAGNTYQVDSSVGNADGDGDVAVAHTVTTAPIIGGVTTLSLTLTRVPSSAFVYGVTIPGTTYVKAGVAEGIFNDGALPATFAPDVGDHLLGFACFQDQITQDAGHGWTSIVDNGGDTPDNHICIATQIAASPAPVSYAPTRSAGNIGDYGAGIILAFNNTPPPEPVRISLADKLNSAGWQQTGIGYYQHAGRVYLCGTVTVLEGGSGDSTILSGLPAGIRPASDQLMIVPRQRTYSLIDTALEMATEWTLKVTAAGDLVVTSAIPGGAVNAPSAVDYWELQTNRGGNPPLPEPTQARYSAPLVLTLWLGNASWELAARADGYTLIAGVLVPNAAVSGDPSYAAHGTRDHLGASLTVVTDAPSTVINGPLPSVIVPNAGVGGDAYSTLQRAGKPWPLTIGTRVQPDEPPTPVTPPSRTPYLSPRLPNDTNTSQSLLDYGRVAGHNYIGGQWLDTVGGPDGDYSPDFWPGLVRGVVEGQVFTGPAIDCSGTSRPGPYGGSLPTATYSIDDLLALVAPAPDWFQLLFYFDYVRVGESWDCTPNTFVNPNATVTLSGLSGAELVDSSFNPATASWGPGFSPSEGFIVPTTPQYSGSSPIAPFVSNAHAGLNDARYFWRAGQIPAGTTFQMVVAATFHTAQTDAIGIQIIPFWEFPRDYLAAGDVLDLAATGWEGISNAPAPPIGVPGILFPGAGSRGQLRHLPVHGNTFGGATLKPAGTNTHDSRNQLSGGQGGSHGFVRYPRR